MSARPRCCVVDCEFQVSGSPMAGLCRDHEARLPRLTRRLLSSRSLAKREAARRAAARYWPLDRDKIREVAAWVAQQSAARRAS